MTDVDLVRGDVVLVELPEQRPSGHEQHGIRPAVVVGLPPREARFPVLVVVPLTSRRRDWTRSVPWLYPTLSNGAGGLTQASTALCDQIRACDASRVHSRLGRLEDNAYRPIELALRRLLGWA